MERWLCHNHENGYANVEVLRFQSKRAKLIAHSTLTTETLAARKGLDRNCCTRLRILEFGFDLDGVLITDCQSLFDGMYSLTSKISEVLVPDFFALRESAMPWRCVYSNDFNGLPTGLWWISADLQLADNFTKLKTPGLNVLIYLLQTGVLHLSRYERPRRAQRPLRVM